MAEHHRPDPIEENVDTHPGRLAIGVLVGAIALVIGIILLVQLAINAYGDRSMKNEPAMSDAAIAARLAPDAKLVVDPNAPAPKPPAQPATPVAQVSPVGASVQASSSGAQGGAGKATFEQVCTACHGTGVLGAPKFGNKADWAPRIAKGKDQLYAHALHGFNAMPPKGGNASLSDADVKAAVDYMVSAEK